MNKYLLIYIISGLCVFIFANWNAKVKNENFDKWDWLLILTPILNSLISTFVILGALFKVRKPIPKHKPDESIQTKFTCECKLTECWLSEYQYSPPCPNCGRVYYCQYNDDDYTFETIEKPNRRKM